MAESMRVPWNEPARVALPRHLYVHVPLCRTKCTYCSFYSVVDDGSVSHTDLVEETVSLLRGWITPQVRWVPLNTLYVGGGTPTALGMELSSLIKSLTGVIPLATGAEVTVEANPDSVSEELLGELADVGVTRVSVGVQSLDDGALSRLGRLHDRAGALDALAAVQSAGLELSVDLMCGIPGVSHEVWLQTLAEVVECGARHVSVYPLTVEPGTPMAEGIAAGRVPAPEEDEVVDAMDAAAAQLQELGLQRYEVANYAVPGAESRHNTAYWTGEPYIGIGGGAHGMLDGEQARAIGLAPGNEADIGRTRYGYASDPFPGGAESPLAFLESLSVQDAAREDAMLGMRLTTGISDELGQRAGVIGPLESLVADGLVTHESGRWKPTVRGWLFGNEVFGRIWGAVE
ncbi:MAG: radical SAM family heme chaperone HemW [Coriobacteriia bacterium]|nr:radical SAM family heme chaperone HemW [Coriobacteriia bacterium]